MNFLSLLPLSTAIINLCAAAYVWAAASRNALRRDYIIFSHVTTAWCLCDFFLFSDLTLEWFEIFLRVKAIFWTAVGFFLLRFAYALAERPVDWIQRALALVMVVSGVAGAFSSLIVGEVRMASWGAWAEDGPLYLPVIVLAIVVPVVISCIIIFGLRRSPYGVTRAQQRLIFVGLVVTATFGLATNVVLPIFFELANVLRLGSTGTVIFSLFIFRALTKHGFMSIGVDEAATKVFENSKDGVILLDNRKRVARVNPAAAAMLDVDAERVLGRDARELLPQLECSQGETEATFEHIQGDDERHLEVSASSFELGGVSLGWVVMLRDVTHIRRVEAGLRANAERFRALSEALPQAVFELDNELRLTWLNSAGQELFGVEQSELDAQVSLRELLSEEDFRRACERLEQRARGGRPEPDEYQILRKNRAPLPVLVQTEPQARLGEPAGAVGFAIDISDRKDRENQLIEDRDQLEAQLRQAQKMEAIGRLAGGVAHDFNNALSVILGCTAQARDELQRSHPSFENLEQVTAAGQRASKVVRQLLAFSRKQTLEIALINVNDIVNELDKMLKHFIREDVDLTMNLEPEIGAVKADPTQVEQVVMNLVVNALDAMPKGGRISLTTKNVILESSDHLVKADSASGPHVLIEVRDTGEGMDDATRDRIFEPFFTTKSMGKGTGLGLATVYGIVTQHGGSIDVESAPGKGSTFSVYLPRAKLRGQASQKESEKFLRPVTDRTLLLVEDDIAVGALAKSILSRFGYTVLDASGPRQALRVARDFDGRLDLLLTDVIMPEMNGRELYETLAGQYEQLTVLYMSGYTDEVIGQQGVLKEDTNFLEKPFSRAQLLRKVQEALPS